MIRDIECEMYFLVKESIEVKNSMTQENGLGIINVVCLMLEEKR